MLQGIADNAGTIIISLILLKNKDKLTFYRENVNQAGMAEKIASQIDDLEDGGFDSASLLAASDSMKNSTRCKCRDIALIWEEYRKVLDSGFIDTFRYFQPDAEGIYSWWSYRFRAREKNAGWRIDYFCVSEALEKNLISAAIHTEVTGSDHCPVELVIDL